MHKTKCNLEISRSYENFTNGYMGWQNTTNFDVLLLLRDIYIYPSSEVLLDVSTQESFDFMNLFFLLESKNFNCPCSEGCSKLVYLILVGDEKTYNRV
jgi:hypothetical protein